MKKPKLRSLAISAAAIPLAVASLAACTPTTAPQVGILGQTVALSHNKDFALVFGTYRCSGGQPGVIWTSVKQDATNFDEHLTEGGSSNTATAWYDSHTPVPCDGKWHNQVFKITSEKGTLNTTTNAWLQFCLTDSAEHLATNDQWVKIT
jgi:hypothetical protein